MIREKNKYAVCVIIMIFSWGRSYLTKLPVAFHSSTKMYVY